MKEHPKLIGDRTTAKVLAALLDVYDCVLMPFGENQRYDLVVEDGERFLRIQCKTGRLRNGVIIFATCSVTYHHPARAQRTEAYRNHYRGQVDYFGVYCPETGGVYMVPVDDVGRVAGTLRVDATLNSQQKNIRWAKDYALRGEAGDASTLFEAPARYAVPDDAGVAQFGRAGHL